MPDPDDQHRKSRASLRLSGDIANPALLVFRFVEVVFAIGTITLMAHQGDQLIVEIGDRYAVFEYP